MDPSTSNGGKSAWSYALSGKIMLSAIVVLFAVVLLILFLHLYVRWHVIRRASRQARRRRRLVFSQAPVSTTVNRGLDLSILASLPVLLFSSDGGQDDESVECAVCLNELNEGEKIRCLPKCSHRFHIECIDMWFYSHSTCPLCRTAVEAVKDTAAANDSCVPPPDAHTADSAENEVCSSCLPEEERGSTSSDPGFREVGIDIPATRPDASIGQEDQLNLGLQSRELQSLKSSSFRMVLIRWLLMRDLRINMGGVSGSDADLERGERVSSSS